LIDMLAHPARRTRELLGVLPFAEGLAKALAFNRAGDLLILNDSRVIPARLRARKPGTQGAVELLLLEEISPREWWAMVRPGRRVRPGAIPQIQNRGFSDSSVSVVVRAKNSEGHCHLEFAGTDDLKSSLEAIGEVPLPPYIVRHPGPDPRDLERYQTVYAAPPGSVAAPTVSGSYTRPPRTFRIPVGNRSRRSFQGCSDSRWTRSRRTR